MTLPGDAAHAMTPNPGQDACEASKDVVVLTKRLEQADEVERALRAYEAERRPRANRFVRRSWWVGRVARWSHPVAVRLRAALARHLFRPLRRRQIARFMDVES